MDKPQVAIAERALRPKASESFNALPNFSTQSGNPIQADANNMNSSHTCSVVMCPMLMTNDS
ncbi:hypothetical protein [Scytonema sp. PRP1]|uniref:hypothetical protein n=1 Tax=Scytonema sp. PRP1 TaxID=3120513 RepID=UPI00300C0252